MKYRITLNIRWNSFYYDFDNAMDALKFLTTLYSNYTGNDEPNHDIKHEATLTVIHEHEEKEEAPTDAADEASEESATN